MPNDEKKSRRRSHRDVVLPFQILEGRNDDLVTGPVMSIGTAKYVCRDEQATPTKKIRRSRSSSILSNLDESDLIEPTNKASSSAADGAHRRANQLGSMAKSTLRPAQEDIEVILISDDEVDLLTVDHLPPVDSVPATGISATYKDLISTSVDSVTSMQNSLPGEPLQPEIAAAGAFVSSDDVRNSVESQSLTKSKNDPEASISCIAEPKMTLVILNPDDFPGDLADVPILQGVLSEVLAWRRRDVKPEFLVQLLSNGASNLVIVPVEFFHRSENHREKLLKFLKKSVRQPENVSP